MTSVKSLHDDAVDVLPGAGRLSSPSAIRARRPSWRDPRLAVGIALICVSVLIGARILAGADDTVPVWASTVALAPGQPIRSEDLQQVQVRFSSTADADRYLAASTDLSSGPVLLRPVGAGELVPRAALDFGSGETLIRVPLAVESSRLPAGVGPGSVVDVWAAPADERSARPAERLLKDVPVLAATRSTGAASGERQVVVGLPAVAEDQLPGIVTELTRAALVLVARDG